MKSKEEEIRNLGKKLMKVVNKFQDKKNININMITIFKNDERKHLTVINWNPK